MFHKKPPSLTYREGRGASARFRLPVFSEGKAAMDVMRWFRANQRDLPWRRMRDPYAIWVSEIMLQQTQVKTVIPYWERWMRELPTIESLARTNPDRVLKLWEGLGYYSRARNLQRAAQEICSKYGGKFPSEVSQILELPGVGRYTAGAIASIAFGIPAAIVDGNVARVISRFSGIRGDPKSRETSAKIWEIAARLVEASDDPSSLNQGLMELGATVCFPRQPECGACPLKKDCFAYANKLTQLLPEIPARASVTARVFRAVLNRRNRSVFLRKRPPEVVNGGFWEMPNSEVKAGLKGEVLCRINHSITRYRITLEVVAGEGIELDGEWVSLERVSTLPLVNAHRKALQKLGVVPASKSQTV